MYNIKFVEKTCLRIKSCYQQWVWNIKFSKWLEPK